MSAQAVEAEILSPMQAIFLPPRNVPEADQAKALRGYVTVLSEFDAPDLKFAWERVLRGHSNRSWPLPQQFYSAANESRRDRRATAPEAKEENDDFETKWRLWTQVSKTQLARDAAIKGVSWSLKCLILNDGKKPEQIDLRALVMQKASAERTATAIREGREIPWRGSMVRFSLANGALALSMWENQLKKESETQNEINYGGRA